MTSSFNEIKQNLRKKEFPHSVRDALKKSDELLRIYSHGWGNKERHMDLISDLISEFVFNECSDRRTKRKQLTYAEELELMLTVLDHIVFDASQNSAIRNALFLLLFPSHKPHRSRFLVLLTSLALSCSTAPVLDSAAVLLQQVGFSSGFSRHFACSLVDGYFLLVSPQRKCVKNLPTLAPLFAANFITALTEAYKNNGVSEDPPVELIELVVEWLRVSNTFVLSPLIRKYQAILPAGSIPMPPLTPHAGLLRWWAVGWSKGGLEVLYNDLETLLLDSLCLCSQGMDSVTCSSVLTSSDLLSVVSVLTGSKGPPSQLCLERFAHILTVILDTKTLFINTQDFWKTLSRLPKNARTRPCEHKHLSNLKDDILKLMIMKDTSPQGRMLELTIQFNPQSKEIIDLESENLVISTLFYPIQFKLFWPTIWTELKSGTKLVPQLLIEIGTQRQICEIH